MAVDRALPQRLVDGHTQFVAAVGQQVRVDPEGEARVFVTEPFGQVPDRGAFTSPFSRCAPAIWNDASDEMLDDDTGFRCATSVEALRELLHG